MDIDHKHLLSILSIIKHFLLLSIFLQTQQTCSIEM